MIFKVGDMSGMRLNEEETVILLSNLLDNAIRECVKVVKAGRKAVIHIKLVQEDGKIIFSVKNPVVEKYKSRMASCRIPMEGCMASVCRM